MLKVLLLILFILGTLIDALQFGLRSPCPYPHFEHGRFRMRQKSNLVKFICNHGYEIVGNKYATCRDGEWDVPLPVCVKPGCPYPVIQNGIPMTSHNGAWTVFFCFPRHQLVGSSAIYCDGRRWNATVPVCVDTSTSANYLFCNFEDSNICGWHQDELHDFDWKRLNKKTPSSFLFTGPSYDHTYGEQGNGYYMYIESTSRLENDTARLISPIYDASLTVNGCFSFFYHMFGKTTGGLRVYQKPDNVPIQTLLTSMERPKYLLFEKWGNQGNVWFNSVNMLKNMSDDFQIVIEGIRGTSFTSDIAIDDVNIMQGENCTAAMMSATTPAIVMPDSCSGRCDLFADAETELGCGCTASCIPDGSCCPDFFEVCIFASTAMSEENSPADQPQTQKLIASTTTEPTTSTSQSTTKTTTSTTMRTTTLLPSTSTRSLWVTSTKSRPSTTVKLVTKTVTPKVVTTTRAPTTRKIPTLVFKTSTPVYNKTGEIQIDILKTTGQKKVATTTIRTTKGSLKTKAFEDRMKYKKEKSIEAHKYNMESNTGESSGAKTAVICITTIALLCAVIYAGIWARGARGREALERLRGRTRHHADVAYLHAHQDDDD